MLINSTPTSETEATKYNARPVQLTVNTSAFSGEDLSEFINLSEDINRRSHLRSLLPKTSPFTKATMTRAEVYEISILDDEQYLTALEHHHQSMFSSPSKDEPPELSPSIHNLLKYFDEDIAVEYNSGRSTPTKPLTVGKVSSMVATLSQKIGNVPVGVPQSGCHSDSSTGKEDVFSKMKRLNEIFEPRSEERRDSLDMISRRSVEQLRKEYDVQPIKMPRTNRKINNIDRLKQKYQEKYVHAVLEVSPEPKHETKNLSPRSKVKQMAQMFNAKISSMIRRDKASYAPLNNSYSPEVKRDVAPLRGRAPIPAPRMLHRTTWTTVNRKSASEPNTPTIVTAAVAEEDSNQMVAEDVFRQLSVKDKVMLYQKFISDMSQKNPKFTKHAQRMSAEVKQVQAEVTGRSSQGLVRQLAQEMEAKCNVSKANKNEVSKPENADAETERSKRHLIVVLRNRKDKKLGAPTAPPRRKRDNRCLERLNNVIEPAFKRNISLIRPVDVFAPPKKIRKTWDERLAPKIFFQSPSMERLFHQWLKHKNGVSFDITAADNADDTIVIKDSNNSSCSPKPNVDKLLEEAIEKLESDTEETISKKALSIIHTTIDKLDKNNDKEVEVELPVVQLESPKRSIRKKKNHAPPIPVSSQSTSAASSDKECDSIASTAPKVSSEESQPEQCEKDSTVRKKHDFFEFRKLISPLKPLRKKKLRRAIYWKNEHSIVERKDICSTTSTTDSDSDARAKRLAKNKSPNRMFSSQRNSNNLHISIQDPEMDCPPFNESIERAINSPRRVKSAYTLAILTSPPAHTEGETFFEPMPSPAIPGREASRSCPSVPVALRDKLVAVNQTLEEKSASNEGYLNNNGMEGRNSFIVSDSFIDQGFETGSNEMEQPMCIPRFPRSRQPLKPISPLFIKLTDELEKSYQRRLSINSPIALKQDQQSKSSTPIRDQSFRYSLASPVNRSMPPQLFFPAPPPKPRRRSMYEGDNRRSSMAIIREGRPLDQVEPRDSLFDSRMSFNGRESDFPKENCGESSKYWISAGDFTTSIDINYNSVERLRLLYEIFSQKCSESKDLHFGVDDHRFSVNNPTDFEDICKRLPRVTDSSHYWFSTGDLAVPFNGKYMSPEKIKRLFNFINASLLESGGTVRFGIDNYEFSKPPEKLSPSPKMSLDSNYSMLVGLQTGSSNGLEGRSKYEWPCSFSSFDNSKMIRTSDLDASEFDSFDNSDLQLASPTKYFNFDTESYTGSEDLTDGTACDGEAPPTSPETFSMDFENEPLDQLFKDHYIKECGNEKILTVPEMLEKLHSQKAKLKAVEERIRAYVNQTKLLPREEFKDSPQHVRKIRDIISTIENIGRDNGFKACSLKQLERFMYFLTTYADLCLATCNAHMDKILDVLMDQSVPEPPENELQKSHEHNPAALSEHQLRVQASLQRLNIPDWFRQYNQTTTSTSGGGYKPGNFTRKRATESGRWAGLNAKTTSLSSLGSQRSDRSPLLLSPSAHSHHGGQGDRQHVTGGQHLSVSGTGTIVYGTGQGGSFSRWSTSQLNSSQTSPSVSQRGSFVRGVPVNTSFISMTSGGGTPNSAIRTSFRQPYLGWRSQEKLSQRTPHERLASSLLAQRSSPTQNPNRTLNTSIESKLQPVTPEIQSSIKEVTSAIVHYVNDQTNPQRSRSTSPNSRKCWLESSFVGTRPLDSPQTPVIETSASTFSAAALSNFNNSSISGSGTPLTLHTPGGHTNQLYSSNHPAAAAYTTAIATHVGPATGNVNVIRMNGGLSLSAPERSLSSASLEDVLASLLGLPTSSGVAAGAPTNESSSSYARSTTGDIVNERLTSLRHMPQQQIHHHPLQSPQKFTHLSGTQQLQQQQQQQQQQQFQNQKQQLDNLSALSAAEQQRLRRRSEGDAQKQQQQQQQQQHSVIQTTNFNNSNETPAAAAPPATTGTTTAPPPFSQSVNCNAISGVLPSRRVSLGDSSESTNNKTPSELQVKCRNNKCDRSASQADAKKYYKSCHNCSHLYCSRECRRAHWEKHRKACLHSRASNLCRQVLSTCKDDPDTQRHLSLLARKGFLSQGRGVVRVLFRSAESAEGFIKHGFQCMGEASYVRWPDLMPAEMGLELYSELLKLSTEYKPDSKMLIYVAICVVSEAPSVGQAPVRWERQLVSRCAKLKLCKTVLAEVDQQQQTLQQQPNPAMGLSEPTTDILILTFNPTLRTSSMNRDLILSNILDILSRRGVLLRKHYPEIYQRLQSYTEGQTDKFNPVTLHPRDSQTGQGFVCIIMPVQSENDSIRLPSAADGGNRVTSIDVGSSTALTQLEDDELLVRSTS